jgi:hypothetical protein
LGKKLWGCCFLAKKVELSFQTCSLSFARISKHTTAAAAAGPAGGAGAVGRWIKKGMLVYI